METTAQQMDQILAGDAARILRISASRLNVLVHEGLLHPVRTPGRIRIFSRAEVEALKTARAEKRLLQRIAKG